MFRKPESGSSKDVFGNGGNWKSITYYYGFDNFVEGRGFYDWNLKKSTMIIDKAFRYEKIKWQDKS